MLTSSKPKRSAKPRCGPNYPHLRDDGLDEVERFRKLHIIDEK